MCVRHDNVMCVWFTSVSPVDDGRWREREFTRQMLTPLSNTYSSHESCLYFFSRDSLSYIFVDPFTPPSILKLFFLRDGILYIRDLTGFTTFQSGTREWKDTSCHSLFRHYKGLLIIILLYSSVCFYYKIPRVHDTFCCLTC